MEDALKDAEALHFFIMLCSSTTIYACQMPVNVCATDKNSFHDSHLFKSQMLTHYAAPSSLCSSHWLQCWKAAIATVKRMKVGQTFLLSRKECLCGIYVHYLICPHNTTG